MPPEHLTSHSTPITAAPILKWAGGKSALLDCYRAFFPAGRATACYEPFAGSAAVFFYLRGRGFADRYVLSDSNEELINTYCVIRDRVNDLIALLAEHSRQHSRDHYYAVRAMDHAPGWPDSVDPVQRAARLIYLNRTCYNGLWRVNSRGHFNVPMGRYRNPVILDEARLRAASAALQGVLLRVCGFREAVQDAGPGDFVYFDPPYVPISATANFTAYGAAGFGADDQRALAATFRDLDARGCRVMLSNSDTPFVRGLYAGFHIETVQAQRRINSRADRRGPVGEVVVRNYT